MAIKLPNFLIVGAAKSGTTSLWHYSKQHPEIFMPINKEPLFFVSSIYKCIKLQDPTYEIVKEFIIFSFEDYIKLFKDAKKEKAIGEASAPYLYYYEAAIPEIKKYLGDIKIIIILRNPADRAFSAYTFLLREEKEILPFERCIEVEEERRKENWSMAVLFKEAGFYYKQVNSYLENFSQVRVYLFDDLKKDPLGLVRDIYEFLEVDLSSVPDIHTKHNVSGVPKSIFLHKFMTRPNIFTTLIKPVVKALVPEVKRRKVIEGLRDLYLEKPEMKPRTRNYLKDLYRDDLLKLQDLIKRDLSHWL